MSLYLLTKHQENKYLFNMLVTSSPYRALLEDSKTKKKCNTKTSTSL